MKRRYSINIICFMLGFLLLTMNMHVFASTVVNVTSISLNKITDTLAVNGVETLIATVNPPTATNQTMTWASSNTGIVNVFNGVVMAVSPGTALITVTTADGNKTAYCMVTVTSVATSISLNKTSDTLTIFGNDTLIATVSQGTGTSQLVNWASSNTAIVIVNNGLIIGVGAGTAIVTATTADGNSLASCVVKVSSPVISINFNKAIDYLTVGGSDVLTVSVNPQTSTNQTVTWASSDTSKVQVTDGIIIAVSAGKATITATTADGGKTATCSVTVTSLGTTASAVTSISLNKSSDTLTLGSTDTLVVAINPTTATNQAITWSSSNTAVANVFNGVVIPVSVGSAIITATSVDGAKTASCIVVVNPINTSTSNVNLVRLGGADRYQTATTISQSGWKTTSSYAVLATGNDYPDALSAAPLAKKYNAPILLTDKNSIPQTVLNELTRLSVTYIFITGGTGVVSKTVETTLNAMGISTERLGGTDRFETSTKIAEKLGAVSGELMVTNGLQYADALSASSIAAKKGIPIILTNKDALPSSTSAFLVKNNFTKTYVLGNTDIISDYVANKFPSTERIVGSDQYERNINIIKRFESSVSFSNICVATGKDFPDALSGSALAAMNSTAIVLVDDSNLKATTTLYISGKLSQINNAYIFGLQGAVSDAAIKTLFNK